MRDYKKYEVWKKAHHLCLFVYKDVAVFFPGEEKFALTSQIKRASYGIPLNIVEGCGRSSERDFAHFLDIALGSVHEVEYCALLAFDLKYIDDEKYKLIDKKVNELKAMLINLIKSIRK